MPRGGFRTNLSGLPNETLDFTNEIQEIVEEILYRGLRFNLDRVKFSFHKDICVVDSKGSVHYADFYPVDKGLDKREIEAINKWRYGFGSISGTAISEIAEILANMILRKINAVLDKKEVAGIVVHFSPGDWLELGPLAKFGYCYVGHGEGRDVIEVETSFYIEEFLYEEPENEDE